MTRIGLCGRVCVCACLHVCMCAITVGKRGEGHKMNMLYGSSKILHGPSAWEEPRAECLWLPNIINYLCAFTSSCCVWPAMSLQSRTGVRVACLFMNTNYTCVSLSLNVSLLFTAAPCPLVKSGAQTWDCLLWILTHALSSTLVYLHGIQWTFGNKWKTVKLLKHGCKLRIHKSCLSDVERASHLTYKRSLAFPVRGDPHWPYEPSHQLPDENAVPVSMFYFLKVSITAGKF